MSRIPPMPLVKDIVEESLTPTHRLNFDSTRSPKVPTIAAVKATASDSHYGNFVKPAKPKATRQEPKIDPPSPSQLLPGEIEGHSL